MTSKDDAAGSDPGAETALNAVIARRLERWPDRESRAAAAQMFAEGTALGEILRRYPEAVPSRYRGKPVQPARRAIYAHYALLQEIQGEPDVNPADRATVEQVISEQGIEWARARTGSALTKYRNDWPNLSWYRSQAPERWTVEYEKLLREKRDSETHIDEDHPATGAGSLAPGLGETGVVWGWGRR
jgi:hypothetical protein